MDYSDIIAEVTDRTGVSDVATRAPMFTAMAEADINRRLRVGAMEKSATVTTDAVGVVSLPDDFLELRSITRAGFPMTQIPFVETQFPFFTTAPIQGAGYAMQGGALVTQLANTAVRLDYYSSIPPLGSASTNWLSDANPDVYIAALMKQVFLAKMDVEKAQAAETVLGSLLHAIGMRDGIARFKSLAYSTDGPTP